jgi:molybdopterin-containing oxidoreductase family iron-sulfur binding subunit
MNRGLSILGAPFARRDFLELVAAATVSAAAGACNREREKLVPYSQEPPDLVPGVAQTYATAVVRDGFATGVIVHSREGKPIKVEGNPAHPSSLGATGPMEQAILMQLYDPSRPRTVSRKGTPDAWRSFLRWAEATAAAFSAKRGAGLSFLLEPSTSPLEAALKTEIVARFPQAKFHFYSPLSSESEPAAALAVFGRAVAPLYDLGAADVIVTLDCDFLGVGPNRLRHAREFADRRDPKSARMNRLYVVEAPLSLTGMMADHRLPMRSTEVQDLALGLFAELIGAGAGASGGPNAHVRDALKPVLGDPGERVAKAGRLDWVRAVARDLARATGRCLVMPGPRQPREVHALAHAMNSLLGNVGKTVRYIEPVLEDPFCGPGALEGLAHDIDAGSVNTLLIGAFDPVYSAPADLDFAARLARVDTTVYHGLYQDRTAASSSWFLPAAHVMESWGDARSPDGTISLQQPLIEPLFGGVTLTEVLAAFVAQGGKDAQSLLREYWRTQRRGSDFDSFWQDTLQKGVIDGTGAAEAHVTLNWDRLVEIVRAIAKSAPPDGVELNWLPSLALHDGCYSDVGWLLELPDPITKLTWDNAAIVSPATANSLSIETGSVVEIKVQGRSVRAPVFVLPMQANDTVSLALGYGRVLPGSLTGTVGVDAYKLRTMDSLWYTTEARIEPTGERHAFANAQPHFSQEGRPLALEATTADLQADSHLFQEQKDELPTLYDPFPYKGYKWAMSIDLNRCIGCAACVVACEAENNSPVIGKREMANGREMQWLRIDRYFVEKKGETQAITQPVMCVHCENAPCEYVCPVNATVHSSEGINQMVYNRCVGTRFCSNNCPYKVRRFNYLAYQKNVGELEAMRLNPDVTVRSRGVMEKCTYCVQRIERARIGAEIARRPIREDEVVTACAEACPSRAIVFGSLNDPDAQVARLRQDERSYVLLHQLGTRPRTTHMARVRNPNPELG